jgi:large subunit ribosomal protein L31
LKWDPTNKLCARWFRAKELEIMKQAIHPEYNKVNVVCSCGNEFETGSVNSEDIKVEVCSECHPFYTGRQKFASADGRVEKFNKKFGFKSANE